MKTSEIRHRFLNFFKKKGHTVVKSDSLIPKNDPTLLFTGAGMNQFKEYFLGEKHDLKRAASSQKCIRTGDLDHVGKTPYHHSFFEMLGNFSFNDYFKRDAIIWAWEFLTQELHIPKAKLLVSVHKNDSEALDIWTREIGMPKNSIARLGDHTNFWPADAPKLGPNGPCGPCSEIFFDQGSDYSKSKNVAWHEDKSGRYAEIWNLVFTQFNRTDDGSLKALGTQNIDTGAGLERLACVLQGKRNNFEIDLFEPLVTYLIKLAQRNDQQIKSQKESDLNTIADHVRAAVVAISDGAHPENEGRGYVIRKLLRRAIWKGRVSGLSTPTLGPLVPLVVDALADAFPELRQNEKSVRETIESEEGRFNETLDSGLELVSQLIGKAKSQKKKQLSGKNVFQLYDTFGFPDELTRSIAQEQGLSIDEKGFAQLLQEQRIRAKKASKINANIFTSGSINKELSALPTSKFLGYQTIEAKSKVLWANQESTQAAFILDQTPFYPEGGGQVGDKGSVTSKYFEFDITDTQKKDHVIIHYGHLTKGDLKTGMDVTACVNKESRNATMRNHTATHLLQSALRVNLGSHVRQVGSLVNSEKLRFDFTHRKALSPDEMKAVECWVNHAVLRALPVESHQESYEKALEGGALAFFGDKYGDRVRTISIKGKSKELCGGTHCSNTGEIGSFIIISESSIGSGTRRIEALTGLNALRYIKSLQCTLQETSAVLKVAPDQILLRTQKLSERIRDLEHAAAKGQIINPKNINIDELIKSSESIGSLKLISKTLQNEEMTSLRQVVDELRKKTKQSLIALFSVNGKKVNLILGLTKDLTDTTLDAKVLAQAISPFITGSAGGRKDLAQGGGRDAKGIENAIKHLKKMLSE
jgi:alanyl-tRNA synthetase